MSTVGALGTHDLGGCRGDEDEDLLHRKIDLTDHTLSHLDRQVDASYYLLQEKKLMNAHQLRLEIEKIPPETYKRCTYYEKWAISITNNCIRQGVFTEKEFDVNLGPAEGESVQLFQQGDRVRVKSANVNLRWRKPHIRTPGFIFNQEGVVERLVGTAGNPEKLAYLGQGVQYLYRVRFPQKRVWSHYSGADTDTVDVEIYQCWLEPASSPSTATAATAATTTLSTDDAGRPAKKHKHGHDHDEHHDHGQGHGHHHEERGKVEQTAVDREGEPHLFEFVQRALITTLVQKKIFTECELTAKIDWVDSIGERLLGAKVVARAWKDAEFMDRLMKEGTRTVESEFNTVLNTTLCVVANTPTVHNVVVCTLCSCYPRMLLGIPPAWYKSREYRARCVADPRGVLTEFGTHIPNNVTVRVHDSTADLRYLVIPQSPPNAAQLSLDQLAKIVTRDGMIGVARI